MTSADEPMHPAISEIKSYLQTKNPAADPAASIADVLVLSDAKAHCKPVFIPPELYRRLINELRAELIQDEVTCAEDLLELPILNDWISEGMGLAHSFCLGQEPLNRLGGAQVEVSSANDKFGDSMLEEMWRYLDWKPKSLPEDSVRGILSEEGLIIELSGVVTGLAKLSLARCFARSCPSMLESRNWHHFEKAHHGHEKRKANLSSGVALTWLPILSFDNFGADAYRSSNNYANNHGAKKQYASPMQLLINKVREPGDTDLLDEFVEEVCEGWSHYDLNMGLRRALDSNTFWRSSLNTESNIRAMERYWSVRALRSLEGHEFEASWTVCLAAALYSGNLPRNRASDLAGRQECLAEIIDRNPEMVAIFEYFNQHAGWMNIYADTPQADGPWTDEAFLVFLSDAARREWFEGVSNYASKELIRSFKRNSNSFYSSRQVTDYFKVMHPEYVTMLCDKMLEKLSFGRMSREYPTAGTLLAEVATHDLRRPERRLDAIDLVNSVRSDKWKLFLVQHLGVSPSDVKLTGRQRDAVFAGNLGI